MTVVDAEERNVMLVMMLDLATKCGQSSPRPRHNVETSTNVSVVESPPAVALQIAFLDDDIRSHLLWHSRQKYVERALSP